LLEEGAIMKVKMVRTICAVMGLPALMLAMPVSGEAAGSVARARFSFDALATCQQPAVQDFPIHTEGTGELSTDRSATLDMTSNVEGRIRYSATLGAKPKAAPGGSTSLRVAGRHTIKAIRDFPNNSIVVYMTVIGNGCAMRIENRLKPGKRQYTFYGKTSVAYCSKPRVTHTECEAY
jgi:hypothetical protein